MYCNFKHFFAGATLVTGKKDVQVEVRSRVEESVETGLAINSIFFCSLFLPVARSMVRRWVKIIIISIPTLTKQPPSSRTQTLEGFLSWYRVLQVMSTSP